VAPYTDTSARIFGGGSVRASQKHKFGSEQRTLQSGSRTAAAPVAWLVARRRRRNWSGRIHLTGKLTH